MIYSKALYNRSQIEINLQEISVIAASQFLNGRAKREVMNAYLTLCYLTGMTLLLPWKIFFSKVITSFSLNDIMPLCQEIHLVKISQ